MDLTQTQVEAIIRLMLLAKYGDQTLSLAEDEDLTKRVESMPWQSGEALDLFISRATAETRKAKDDPSLRVEFLAAQQEALEDKEARRYALKQLTGLLQADGIGEGETGLLKELGELLG